MDCASCKYRVWLQGVANHVCTACKNNEIQDESLLHYFITKTRHPKCPIYPIKKRGPLLGAAAQQGLGKKEE